MKAYAGQSPTLDFTVISDSKCEQDKFVIYFKKNSSEVTDRRFQINRRKIIIGDVKETDSGEYTICCHDHIGVEGEAKFTLEIAGRAHDAITCKSSCLLMQANLTIR